MRRLTRVAARLARDRRGSMAPAFAVVLAAVLGLAAISVDVARTRSGQVHLQGAADAAALAGALSLPGEAAAREAALANAAANLPADAFGDVLDQGDVRVGRWDESGPAFVPGGSPPDAVEVTLRRSAARGNALPLAFASVLGYVEADIARSATARAAMSAPCLIAFAETGSGIELAANASVTVLGCHVWSNSTDADSISAASNSLMTVEDAVVCSAGGVAGDADRFDPYPATGCAPKADPLAALAAPPSSCAGNAKGTSIGKEDATLHPGIYCGGIAIGPDADVTLAPGTYVLDGGGLRLRNNSTLSGSGVTLVFKNGAVFDFHSNTEVTLVAPATGDFPGIVVFQDRDYAASHAIRSNNVTKIEGVFYMPTGDLELSSNSSMTGSAAWTGFLVHRIRLSSNTSLDLRSDYASTGTPLPAGLLDVSVALVR